MQTNFTTAQLRDPQIEAAHRAVVKILLRTERIRGKCLLQGAPLQETVPT